MSSVNLYFNNKSLKIFPIEFKFKAFKLKKDGHLVGSDFMHDYLKNKRRACDYRV